MIEIDARQRLGKTELKIDLKVETKGILALFGPSGAGKTSILNWLAGLNRPDDGIIRVDGQTMFDRRAGIDIAPERRRLGYVFQEPRLFPHLGVRGNLLYGRRLTHRRYGTQESDIGFDWIVELLGIGGLLERRIATLSGGEKQRVAIGRALLANPRLLLMDEPLAAVDVQRKSEILPFIEKLHAELSVPIVYVSHDPDEILRLADQVALIADGKLAAYGDVESVLGRLDLPNLTDNAEAGAVIGVTVLAQDDGSGLSLLGFSGAAGQGTACGGVIRVGRLPHAVGQHLNLRILANNVALARQPVNGMSILNQLPGRVSQIVASDGPFVDVQVDIGSPIWARITRKSLQELNLSVGDNVIALVKSAAADPKPLR
ncbi:molybdenum ABC transporter ATP-binding protein [Dongia soli]|uniref:Molybdenum ABC transporter ATP-binding protein n=1 Tax=Dongia soli TaxID=600628 RepID=A0ABU5EFA8_9PROT|nr:molybdenum ABC transporter ATP-binding protein [Dongia soli]MDY0885017.1 molybdenum ABC transporter ATP-binding protein [Dongia soli]